MKNSGIHLILEIDFLKSWNVIARYRDKYKSMEINPKFPLTIVFILIIDNLIRKRTLLDVSRPQY
jgi:hypothetical protein